MQADDNNGRTTWLYSPIFVETRIFTRTRRNKKEKESERELWKKISEYPKSIDVRNLLFTLTYEPPNEVKGLTIQNKNVLQLHIFVPISYIVSGRNPIIKLQSIIE